MSRSGYDDGGCIDNWDMIRWRGAVASAIRGRRGQEFLKELLSALDSLPEKRLVENELETKEGQVCTLGAIGRARGVPMQNIDPEDYCQVARHFTITETLAREIMYENDEGVGYWVNETPEQRFDRMRSWVVSQLEEQERVGA